MAGFIFGGNTGETAESLARKRRVAEALVAPGATPQDVPEGLNAVARALVGRIKMGQVEKAEADRQQRGNDAVAKALGQHGPFPAAPAPVAGPNPVMAALNGAPKPANPNLPSRMDFAQAKPGFDVRGGLIARGLPEHVADAFVMNFQDESGLNPGINEQNPTAGRGGFGLSQWTGPRRQALEAYAAQRGVGADDPNMQLDYLMSELQGPEADAYGKIMAAPDTGSAATAILNNFLRPAEQHRAAREAKYTGGVQVAQAGGDFSQYSPAAGGTGGTVQPGQLDLNLLFEAARNPDLDEQGRGLINLLLEQEMEKRDPLRQMQIQKLQRELAAPAKRDTSVVNNRLIDNQTGQVISEVPADAEWQRLDDDTLFNRAGGTKELVNGPKPPKFDDVSGLRKEIQQLPSYKNLGQAAPIYKSMFETAGRNSRASDLNLVYGLGKIMDPTSVVREGEMVMVKNTASIPDWLQGAINSLNGGAALTTETRQAILKEAYGRIEGYQGQFSADAEQYKGIVGRNNMNEADVIPSFGEFQEWSPQTVSEPKTDDEYDALPSGALFRDPDDGKVYEKP